MFVATTMPKTDTSALGNKNKYTAVFTVIATAMEIAAYCGFPCAVRQADKVCTQESVKALNDNPLTRVIKVDNSSPCKLRKMSLTIG